MGARKKKEKDVVAIVEQTTTATTIVPTTTADAIKAADNKTSNQKPLLQKAKHFFTVSLPDFFKNAVPNFFKSTVLNFFKNTVPNFFKSTVLNFTKNTVPNFFKTTVPNFFNNTVPNFFKTTVPNFFKAIGDFFTKSVPNFIKVTLPNLFKKKKATVAQPKTNVTFSAPGACVLLVATEGTNDFRPVRQNPSNVNAFTTPITPNNGARASEDTGNTEETRDNNDYRPNRKLQGRN